MRISTPSLLPCHHGRLGPPPSVAATGPPTGVVESEGQAFTHLALISAAYDLDRRLSTAGRAD